MKRRLVVLLVSTMAVAVALGMAGVRLASARPSLRYPSQEKPTADPALGPSVIGPVSLTLQPRLGEGPKEPASIVMSQDFEGAWPAAGWDRFRPKQRRRRRIPVGKTQLPPAYGQLWRMGGRRWRTRQRFVVRGQLPQLHRHLG